MDKHNKISQQEVAIWRTLSNSPDLWMTNQQIAVLNPLVCPRTIRAHTKRMVSDGLIDMADVFPGPRYRFSEEKARRHAAYVAQIDIAAKVFTSSM